MKRPLLPVRSAFPVLCRAAACAGVFLLPACFGVMDRAEQPVTVFTDPPGAYCVLSRNGDTVGIVTPSPGLLHVGNSKHHISVRCSKALHEDETAVLAASRRDLSIGDVMVKGPVGLAYDAGTSGLYEYPPSITLFLAPLSFDSTEKRDRHYDRLKAKVLKDAAAAIARIDKKCTEPLTSTCRNRLKAVETARDAETADLEAKRRRAGISGG